MNPIAICLRCLEKEPSLRYESAQALAQDVVSTPGREDHDPCGLARPVRGRGHRGREAKSQQRVHLERGTERHRYPQNARAARRIDSALGSYESSLDLLLDDARFRFVLSAINQFKERVPTGFSLTIESDFSHQVGLGSSAAVTVAVLAVLNFWMEQQVVVQWIPTSFSNSFLVCSNMAGQRIHPMLSTTPGQQYLPFQQQMQYGACPFG